MRSQYTTIAIVVAGLLLVAALADVIYRFAVPTLARKDTAAEVVPAGQRRAQDYQVNVGAIIAAHLFGRQQQVVQRQQEAPVTRLQLRLLGVMSSPNEAYARALIAVGGDRGEAYRVGDQIANTDAKLHEIADHLVLLDRGGRLERLELIRDNVINAPVGEDQDPAELPSPSPNDVEGFYEQELEPQEQVPEQIPEEMPEQVPPEMEQPERGEAPDGSAEPPADGTPRTWLRAPGNV